MKRPSFFEGVAAALVLSLGGGAVFVALSTFAGTVAALRFVIAATGLAYVLYLLSRSRDRVGRITTLVLWLFAAGAAWWLEWPLLIYLSVHLGLIWLVRSLYFYSSLLPALADMGLLGLGLAAAVWALSRSGSVFLALWCFFLVQAIYIVLPSRLAPRAADHEQACDERFERAYRAAQAAVRQLSIPR